MPQFDSWLPHHHLLGEMTHKLLLDTFARVPEIPLNTFHLLLAPKSWRPLAILGQPIHQLEARKQLAVVLALRDVEMLERRGAWNSCE